MEKKRPDLSELRQQRERIGRFTVGAFAAALVFIVASCQGLTAREAEAPPELSPSRPTTQAPRDAGSSLSYAAQATSPTDRGRAHS